MGYDKENARKEDCMRPLYDCALFQGLPEAELHAALRFFAAQERACPRGALLKASRLRCMPSGWCWTAACA